MKTTEFETDDKDTVCHILVVSDEGECLQQLKVRKARDYSPEYMLEAGCKELLKLAKRKRINV